MVLPFKSFTALPHLAVYAIDGRLNRNFLLRTKKALANIASLADELHNAFPLHLDQAVSGISRISAYLHLLYHQCIVLATRPLLFCFLKIRLESPENCISALNKSRNVRNLIQMCVDSSQQIISILHSLQSEGLLGKHQPRHVKLHSLTPIRNIPPFRPRIYLCLNRSPSHGPSHRHALELPNLARKSLHDLRRHDRERQSNRQIPTIRTSTSGRTTQLFPPRPTTMSFRVNLIPE